MYHGQFFGKIVHEILTMSMKYGQSRKKLFCPWTVGLHGQLSAKHTTPDSGISPKLIKLIFNHNYFKDKK
jgi:hypothetical protein